ncbi:MAG: 50S ribosomal protein L4 [Actinomycetota bacterium]|jgi:large subunit ribosomal protein L4|nr:50S ribosomal protein L4 [Actinomycetota bacterium]
MSNVTHEVVLNSYAAPLVDQEGNKIGDVELNPAIFGYTPNIPLIHQVVVAQLAAARRGTQSTKTRSEVRGGGRKPFRQKGTGRARQGSTRAPHWAGGGVALGPKPRLYTQRTPKKMKRAALYHSLSDRASANAIVVVDSFNYEEPKTKIGLSFLANAGLAGKKILLVVDPYEYNLVRTFSNLPLVRLIDEAELNPYDVLWSDVVVFDKSTLLGDDEGDDDGDDVEEEEAK